MVTVGDTAGLWVRWTFCTLYRRHPLINKDSLITGRCQVHLSWAYTEGWLSRAGPYGTYIPVGTGWSEEMSHI